MRKALILFVLFLATVSGRALAEKRVALVIGNSAYQHAVPLANPKNDASDIAAKLKSLGFEVVSNQDLDLAGMRRTVREFLEKLDGADLALFFYAGHGVQVNGSNYMVPVDAQLSSYNDLDFEALPMDLVLSAMERSTKTNLIFLDACRDNPFAENLSRSMGTRSSAVGRGLARLGSGVGSLIAFATQPGNVALDGGGRNSPFTAALLTHLGTPGQDITRDLVNVRRDVLAATAGKQVPWENSSLTGDVVLNPLPAEPQTGPLPQAAQPDSSVELAYWASIKDSTEKSFFEAYLQQFPTGSFAAIARLKIDALEKGGKAERVAAAEPVEQQSHERAANPDVSPQTDVASLEPPGSSQSQPAVAPGHQLTAAELKAQLIGRRIAWKSGDGSASGVTTFEVDGTVVATVDGDQNRYEGTWRIKGDTLCEKFEKEVCAPINWVAANRYSKAGRGTLIVDDSQQTDVASLEPPGTSAQQPLALKPEELALATQTELVRIGCLAGPTDGKWGSGSRKALQDFATRQGSRLVSLEPTEELLKKLRSVGDRVCPLVCGDGMKAEGDRCVELPASAAFDGIWIITRTATKKACNWRSLSARVFIDQGKIASTYSYNGQVLGDGSFTLSYKYTDDKGEEQQSNITGKLKAGKGIGKFVNVGGACEGVVDFVRS